MAGQPTKSINSTTHGIQLFKKSRQHVRRELQVDLADESDEKAAVENGRGIDEHGDALLGREEEHIHELQGEGSPSRSKALISA